MLRELGNEIIELFKAGEVKDTQIAELQAELNVKIEEITNKDNLLTEKENKIVELNNEIMTLNNSIISFPNSFNIIYLHLIYFLYIFVQQKDGYIQATPLKLFLS